MSLLSLLQVCGAQGISGTGSLRLGMQFLKKFYSSEVVYVSKPTWGEIFRSVYQIAVYIIMLSKLLLLFMV